MRLKGFLTIEDKQLRYYPAWRKDVDESIAIDSIDDMIAAADGCSFMCSSSIDFPEDEIGLPQHLIDLCYEIRKE